MVDELIVHIGTHKTGTTAIQSALNRSRRHLADMGILYPDTGRGWYGRDGRRQQHPGHTELAAEAAGRTDAAANRMKNVADEVAESTPNLVVLSSESLGLPKSAASSVSWVERLARQIEAEHVRPVIFLRPQWEYLESSYAQLVKGGNTHLRFGRYLPTGLKHPRFHYSELISPWAKSFGTPQILGYSEASTVSSVTRFANDVLGKPDLLTDVDGEANPRGGEKTIEMLRCLCGLLNVAGMTKARSEIFLEARQRLNDGLGQQSPFRALTSESIAKIADHFEHSNAVVFSLWTADQPTPELVQLPDELPPPSRWRLDHADQAERALFTGLVDLALSHRR